jgi:hypothetical protein
VSSNMGHWPWYQLARDGQAQAHFGWRTWQSTQTVPCNFLPQWRGAPFSILSYQLRVKLMHPWLINR